MAGYPPLNNVTAPDEYGSAIVYGSGVRIRILVSNQGIYYQEGLGISQPQWGFEQFLPPGFYSLDAQVDAIQIRAAIPAAEIPANQQQAQVTARIISSEELPA